MSSRCRCASDGRWVTSIVQVITYVVLMKASPRMSSASSSLQRCEVPAGRCPRPADRAVGPTALLDRSRLFKWIKGARLAMPRFARLLPDSDSVRRVVRARPRVPAAASPSQNPHDGAVGGLCRCSSERLLCFRLQRS